MFKKAIRKLFPHNFTLTFKNTEDIIIREKNNLLKSMESLKSSKSIESQELKDKILFTKINNYLNNFNAIIIGGGGVFGNFFFKFIYKYLVNYNNIIIALGVGIDYESFIFNSKKCINIFDHIFLREETDLLLIQRIIGSEYIHFLPDLAFKLDYSKPSNLLLQNKKNNNTIGIFLANSLRIYENIVDIISIFIDYILEKGYNVIFYRFDTSNNIYQDDSFINSKIYNKLKNKNNVYLDNNVYSVEEMLENIGKLYINICVRFHSHIFSIMNNVPFLSISITRKTRLLMLENDMQEYMIIKENSNINKYIEVFEKIVKEREKYINILKNLDRKFRLSWKNNKVYTIINLNKRRIKNNQYINNIFDIDRDCISNKIYKMMEEKYNIVKSSDGKLIRNISSSKSNSKSNSNDKLINNSILTYNEANFIARILCFLITNEPGSKYIYGTINNLLSSDFKNGINSIELMIDYIYKEQIKSNIYSNPSFYIDYISQWSIKGLHRSGWEKVLETLYNFNSNNGVLLDTYLDRTFGWSKIPLLYFGIIPYTSPWVGFIHHTFNTSYSIYNADLILKDEDFIKSLNTCKGLYVFCDFERDILRKRLDDLNFHKIPIQTIVHPTEFNVKKWNIDIFGKNRDKKIVNIGAWYRNPFSIHEIDLSNIKWIRKCSLKGKLMENYFPPNKIVIFKDFKDEILFYNNLNNNLDVNLNTNLDTNSNTNLNTDSNINLEQNNIENSMCRVFSNNLQNNIENSMCRVFSNNLDINLNTDSNTNLNTDSNINLEQNNIGNKWIYFLKEYIMRYISKNKELEDILKDNNKIIFDYNEKYNKNTLRYKLSNHLKSLIESVSIIKYLNNNDYDDLLSKNIVFLNLVSCSAINTLIECIVRETPIIINKLPPIVSLLGEEYPLYYENLEEINNLVKISKIYEANIYLKKLNKEKLRLENMTSEITNGKIYKNLFIDDKLYEVF